MKKLIISGYITISCCNVCYCQNIGIGTTNPVEKLHVAGNLKADTIKPNAITLLPNAAEGKVMISDNNGNAGWRTSSALSGAGNIGYGVWGDCATNGNISEYLPLTDSSGTFGDIYGYSVSISGNYAIIGSPKDDVGGNIDQGSASIYQYTASGWVLMQKITDQLGAPGDFFGNSVSISGDYAVVGAPLDDVGGLSDVGTATVFKFNGTSWVSMQTLTGSTTGDRFGTSVSQSGNYVICGAPNWDVSGHTDQGAAVLYQYPGGFNWVLVGVLTDPAGAAGDNFGTSVSMSGNFAIVGSPNDDVGASTDPGSATIYQYNGSQWIWTQTLSPSSAGDNFGYSVSLSGSYALIGAPKGSSGQGYAVIYQYNGSSWAMMQSVKDVTGAANDNFGYSVSLSGNYAMVGAYIDDVGANVNQGSATVFIKIGQAWQKLQYITDPAGMVADVLGVSCAIDAVTKRFIIGADGFNSFMGKAVFGKLN